MSAATNETGSLLTELQAVNCYGLPRVCPHPQGRKKIPEGPNAAVRNTITGP